MSVGLPRQTKPRAPLEWVRKQSATALAENGEVNQPNDSKTEEKGISLEIADLEQAQKKSAAPAAAAQTADDRAIKNPAINKAGEPGQYLLRRANKPLIKCIEVKAIAEKRDVEGIAAAIAIEQDRPRGPEEEGNERNCRRGHSRSLLVRQIEKAPGEESKTAERRRDRQQNQRNGHDHR